MGVSLKVKAGKLKLNSPIVMVSGTFGYGTEKFDFIDYKKMNKQRKIARIFEK